MMGLVKANVEVDTKESESEYKTRMKVKEKVLKKSESGCKMIVKAALKARRGKNRERGVYQDNQNINVNDKDSDVNIYHCDDISISYDQIASLCICCFNLIIGAK